jgi:hypothetical protein
VTSIGNYSRGRQTFREFVQTIIKLNLLGTDTVWDKFKIYDSHVGTRINLTFCSLYSYISSYSLQKGMISEMSCKLAAEWRRRRTVYGHVTAKFTGRDNT